MRTPLHGKQEASVAERALARWGDTVWRGGPPPPGPPPPPRGGPPGGVL